jgi:hypothetical protein
MAGKKTMSMRKRALANKTVKSFPKSKMKKFLLNDNQLKAKLMRYRMKFGL